MGLFKFIKEAKEIKKKAEMYAKPHLEKHQQQINIEKAKQAFEEAIYEAKSEVEKWNSDALGDKEELTLEEYEMIVGKTIGVTDSNFNEFFGVMEKDEYGYFVKQGNYKCYVEFIDGSFVEVIL